MGLQFSLLLGGAVLTETTFSWPGLGSALVDFLNARDYAAVQGIVTFFAVVVVVVSLAIDIINGLHRPPGAVLMAAARSCPPGARRSRPRGEHAPAAVAAGQPAWPRRAGRSSGSLITLFFAFLAALRRADRALRRGPVPQGGRAAPGPRRRARARLRVDSPQRVVARRRLPVRHHRGAASTCSRRVVYGARARLRGRDPLDRCCRW